MRVNIDYIPISFLSSHKIWSSIKLSWGKWSKVNLEKKDNFFLEKKKKNYGVYSLRMLPREPRITEVWGWWGTEQEKSIGSSGKK